VSSKSRNRSRKPAAGGGSAQVRAQKRAQFQAPRSRTRLHLIGAAVALAVVVGVALFVVAGRGGGSTAQATTASAGGDVKLAMSAISDGKAHFYTYDANGVAVKYFVMKSSDGKFRVAFDGCEVCYSKKKGYHQEGDQMVCNNCGRRFPSADINVITGGCNPIPVDKTEQGGDIVITASTLQAGAKYFQ
jgi:uncharacterized membrane protein